MGHADLSNISRITNRLLLNGPTTIKEVVDFLEKEKEAVHAGEGLLDDPCMLAYGVEQVIGFLLNEERIEPVKMTLGQRKVFKQWGTDTMSKWDSGPGTRDEYGVFDSILWKSRFRKLPVLGYVTN